MPTQKKKKKKTYIKFKEITLPNYKFNDTKMQKGASVLAQVAGFLQI